MEIQVDEFFISFLFLHSDASVHSAFVASRNVRFRRAFYDWELESVNSFVDLLYSNVPRGEWCDKMRWRLNASGGFDVTSYLVC